MPSRAVISYTFRVSDVAPFPFARLPKVGGRDCALLRMGARSLPLRFPAALLDALSGLLGAPLRVAPAPLETCPAGALSDCIADPLAAIIVETGASARAPLLAIELDPRLALCIVDRALGGTGGREIAPPLTPLSEVARGVLAYVGARAIHATGSTAHRVRTVVTSGAALASAIGDKGSLVWPASLAIGDDSGVVRVWIPEPALVSAPSRAWRVTSDALSALSIAMAVEVGGARLTIGELASLVPGDVVVLDHASVALSAGQLTGTGTVRAVGATRTRWQVTIAGGQARVDGRARNEERQMTRDATKAERTADAIDLVGDAPIELRVEIARVSLPLEDLAKLTPGEVVTTGRLLGAEVVLRAADQIIATGELVDVDGEIGVRVLRLGA